MSSPTNKQMSYLPMEKFPEWTNDERMNALFAPFRKDSSNDQDFTSKINFWSRAIHEYLKTNQRCSFSILELEQAFERKHAKPQCLSYVIEAMLSSGEIVAEEEFLNLSVQTWSSWAMTVFVKSPSTWVFSQLKNYVGNKIVNIEQKFIHLQNAKILTNSILDCTDTELDNKAISFGRFITILKEKITVLDDITAKHILVYLYKMKKATFHPLETNRLPVLVKLSKHNASNITSQELTIESLKTKERYLTREIQELEEKQSRVLTDIKKNLNQNRKQAAKILLKKKKEIDRIIEVRSNALIGIETMLMRISDAHMNVEMIEGYSMVSNVLKSYKKEVTEDKVLDVQEELCEKFEEIQSMEEIMAESVGNSNLNDADLEQELAELLKDTEEDKMAQIELPDLTKLNLKELPVEKISEVKKSESDKTLASQKHSL